ncbi:alpha/beta hydrolase [Arthrobacter echini]|uniref:Alpha/beta hydrolase n=1 Tax=Arthrobacter echini TaxID=1529066 RepID=A0A4V3Z4Z3_9MICC|nr:alpha/beta hydrolase [Arthrobacter echini]THJ64629.1 alpha/beta hydrolase [Arthrobacter echini]
MDSAPSALAERHNVRISGRPDGPVLLFAHGFGCDRSMWRRVLPYFEDGFRVVAFDHMGSGRSDLHHYDPEKYSTLDGYAADILALCEDLELHEVVLVAHSVATMMAVVAAIEEPDRFRRLVFVAPSPSYIDDPGDGYVGGFTQQDIDGLLESLDSNYFAWSASLAPVIMGNPGTPVLTDELETSFCRTDPDTARTFARVSFLSDIRSRLADLRVPSLILQCSEDMLAPLEVGRYLDERLAGSTLVELAATGHVPQASAPEETAQAILQYLSAAAR